MIEGVTPGTGYGTVVDIRDCADLPEMPFTPGERMADGSYQPYWKKSDGTPITVLLRAPSLAERREIEKVDPADVMGWVLETCFYCIKEPPFTREQIAIFESKNAKPLIQINDKVWDYLAEFPAVVIDRAVREIAGLSSKEEQQPEPAKPTRARKKPAP